jgi:SAM-dependent methyltransferase
MWEQRYGTDEYLFGTEPNEFLRDSVPVLPAGSVLCLAEGEGRNAVFLAECGFDVHSVDLTEAGVAKTRRLAERRGVKVDAAVGDLADFPIGTARWDVIVSIFAHMPPLVRRDLHHRVVVALKPGGMFLLEAYTPQQVGRGTGGPSTPELTMTIDALRVELAGLELLHAEELEREVVEGPGHTGSAAVVQVIARKPV